MTAALTPAAADTTRSTRASPHTGRVPVSVTPATSLAALADLVRSGGVVILSGAGISTYTPAL